MPEYQRIKMSSCTPYLPNIFFNDYISKVPNWQFIGSYIDCGISGTSVNKREEIFKND